MLSAEELAEATKQCQFCVDEDDGIQIPGLHPFYNLPVHVQLLILDLTPHKLDPVLNHIASNTPSDDKDEYEWL